MNPISIEELRKVVALSDLPDEHLQWILNRAELHVFEDGEILAKTGDPAELMWMFISGRIDFYMNVNGQLVFYNTFENDQTSGGVTGLLPYSRMKTYPGNAISVGTVRAVSLHKKYFQELEQLNPDLIQRLIGYMTERARWFATVQLQREKVNALGKLAAGIAHEMNNPASAISRIATELDRRLELNFELTERLVREEVTAEHIRHLREVAKTKRLSEKKPLSAMQRMQSEDDIIDWLTQSGFPENREVAESFAEFGFTTEELDAVCEAVPKSALIDMLLWLENLLISERLLGDLEDASTRITRLVGAIKSHVHMDRTDNTERTNLHADIDNTLTLLGYKMRDKNISVTKHFSDDMPQVEAYVGELNQVWTNVIDNAIDAMEKDGELTISAFTDNKMATIRIADNGSGIPKDIQSRIFDPFFTTKKVGQGTGIGLDIVKKIIDKHHGEIKVYSEPGKTEFTVCIPLVQQHTEAKEETKQ